MLLYASFQGTNGRSGSWSPPTVTVIILNNWSGLVTQEACAELSREIWKSGSTSGATEMPGGGACVYYQRGGGGGGSGGRRG
mmetsp:Transcript_26739/g.41985  ORF Transcript_26739/g.41985 Transcript_26739/m.41985 type:complete len:82 (-) Transcript_26739:1-246(-)